MASFVGAGHAVRDLVRQLSWQNALWLGVPQMQRPINTNEPYKQERKMTWSELFFDLIFVTGVRILGDLLRVGLVGEEGETTQDTQGTSKLSGDEKEPSVSLSEYIVLFLALWALWVDQLNYGTRWGANDVWNFFHFGFYMMGVVSFVVALSHIEKWAAALYLSAFTSYTVEALSNARILRFNSTAATWRVRQYALTELAWGATRLSVCAFGFFHSGGVHIFSPGGAEGKQPEDWIKPLLALGLFPHVRHAGYMLGGLVSGGNYMGWLPFHIEHFSERISLLMIIYLGDGVDNITGRASHLPILIQYVVQVLLAFFFLLGLKLLLLDSSEVETDQHAIRRSAKAALLYQLALPFQAFGLAFVSSGLALTIGSDEAGAEGQEARARWGTELLCDGTALVLGAFVVIALAHTPPKRPQATPGCDKRIYHYRALLVHAYQLQLLLNAVALAFAILAPRTTVFHGKPALLLGVLALLVYVVGAANLLDEVAEGQLEALKTAEEEEREAYAEALDKLRAIVKDNAALTADALEAIKAAAPSMPAPAASTSREPLLAEASYGQGYGS